MRWNVIVECVGEDGQRSTITLGTIERLAASTNRGKPRSQTAGIEADCESAARHSSQATVNKGEIVSLVASSDRSKTSAADGWILSWGPWASGFRDIDVGSAAPAHRFGARLKTKIAFLRHVKVKYPLFGKALSDLFGIVPEIGDRMNNNPV